MKLGILPIAEAGRWRVGRALATLAAMLLPAGCGSVTSFQRARTLAAGDVEIGASAGLMVPQTLRVPSSGVPLSDIEEEYPTFAPFFGIPIGILELGVGYGFHEVVEGRARLSAVGAEIGTKIRILHFESPSLYCSIAPSARGRLGAPVPALDLVFPVLVGISFGEADAHEIVLSSRYMPTISSSRGVVHGVGGGLGAIFAVSANGSLILESGLLLTTTGTDIPGATAAAATLGVGFLWTFERGDKQRE